MSTSILWITWQPTPRPVVSASQGLTLSPHKSPPSPPQVGAAHGPALQVRKRAQGLQQINGKAGNESRKSGFRPQALGHFVLQPWVKARGTPKVHEVAGFRVQVSFLWIHTPPSPTPFFLPDFSRSPVSPPPSHHHQGLNELGP